MNLETLLSLPRNVKKTFFVIHDVLMIFIAFWFAQSLRVQYSDEWASMANWLAFGSTAFLTIALFVRLGLYRAVTRFVSTRVLTAAAFGSLISAVLFCLTTLVFERKLHLALPVVYFLLLVVCITSSRMILRAILTDRHKKQWRPSSFTAQDNPAANCWKPSNRSTNIPLSPLWTTTPKSAAPSSTI